MEDTNFENLYTTCINICVEHYYGVENFIHKCDTSYSYHQRNIEDSSYLKTRKIEIKSFNCSLYVLNFASHRIVIKPNIYLKTFDGSCIFENFCLEFLNWVTIFTNYRSSESQLCLSNHKTLKLIILFCCCSTK